MAARHTLAATGLAAAALALGTTAALPAQADPPGNNGTVFIHDVAGDDNPHNVPHVSCAFFADFFGFDKDQQVSVSFAGQAPTGKDVQLGGSWGPGVISTTHSGGAGNDFDHELSFTADELRVSALGTPAKPGYHVTMTVLTGEPGGKKTKVFWLQPCSSAQAASTQSTAQTSSAAPTAAAPAAPTGDTASTPTAGPAENAAAVLGVSLTAPATQATGARAPTSTNAASPAQVLGERITRSNAAHVLGARLSRATGLPFTGAVGIVMMSLLGLLLTASGVLAMTAARRRRSA